MMALSLEADIWQARIQILKGYENQHNERYDSYAEHSLMRQTHQVSSLSIQDQQGQIRVWKISLFTEPLQWEGLHLRGTVKHLNQ